MTVLMEQQQRAEHVTSRRAERTAKRYLAAFFVTCLVLYLSPVVAERAPTLQPYSGSNWGLVIDQSYDLANINADVVIFGDSSAFYSIDTPRLSADLGLKVINLPQSIGSLAVTGDVPLRRYLAHNKPPRLLLFYVSPWDRDFNAVPNVLSYEGVEQLVRHGTPLEVLQNLRSRPGDLLTFPLSFYVVRSQLTRLWNTAVWLGTPHAGFMPYPVAPAIATHCVLSRQLLTLTSTHSLDQLQADYGHAAGGILTVLAPVPNCGGAEQLAARLGPALTVLPPSYFVDDAFFIHPLAQYTGVMTDRVERLLRERLTLTR